MFAAFNRAKGSMRVVPAIMALRGMAVTMLRGLAGRYCGKRLALLSAAMALPAMAAPADIRDMAADPALPSATDMSLPQEGAGTQSPVGSVSGRLHVSGQGIDMLRAQDCMATALYYEANTEGEAGQRAVAQVILNRVAHRDYPKSVCGVVFQGSHRQTGCQFSFTCDGSFARHRPSDRAWSRASRIAREALAGSVYRPVGLATHYHTTRINPYWAPRLQRVNTVGTHHFYRKRGTSGAAGTYDFSYLGGEPTVAKWREEPVPETELEQAAPAATGETTTTTIASGPAESLEPPPAGEDTLPRASEVQPEFAQSGQWLAGSSMPAEHPAP